MTSALQNEAAFIPDKPGDLTKTLEELRPRLYAMGHSVAVVNGLTGWLVAKAIGERDTTESRTRAKYRRILRELAESGPSDDPKRSRRTHRATSKPPIIIDRRVLSSAGAQLLERVRIQLQELDEAV